MIKIQPEHLSEILERFLFGAKDPKGGNIPAKLQKHRKAADEACFWNFLSKNLDTILVGNPFQLQRISEIIEKNLPIEKLQEARVILEKIFNYDGFTKNQNNGWNAYWLAERLNIDTCPYCNRLYTHTVTKGSDKITRPQFDHFMDKATYPYLAVSFYNLVPSCAVCNSGQKGTKKFTPETHSHPYLEGYGNLTKFHLKIADCSFFSGNLKAGKIEFANQLSPLSENEELQIRRSKNNIEDFKLVEIYQNHLDYAQEQVGRAMVYNSDYLDSLFRQFEGSLFRNREDLTRFVASNYTDDENLHQRPLSKLTKDIAEQFDLWGWQIADR